MKKISLLVLLFLLVAAFTLNSFKSEQKRYKRVRTAYAEKEEKLLKDLSALNVTTENLRVYIRAFKEEQKLEVWVKNVQDSTFQQFRTYDFCETSGEIGPKRRQGDYQIPEGFYYIDRFNPASNFYLSLGINYPNKSDRILGEKGFLGGDIFIHGSCVTVGCIPLTDPIIKELYILCVEAKDNGQQKIPVTFYPAKLNTSNFNLIKNKYQPQPEVVGLWEDLKKDYENFEAKKSLSTITFLKNGRHLVESE